MNQHNTLKNREDQLELLKSSVRSSCDPSCGRGLAETKSIMVTDTCVTQGVALAPHHASTSQLNRGSRDPIPWRQYYAACPHDLRLHALKLGGHAENRHERQSWREVRRRT